MPPLPPIPSRGTGKQVQKGWTLRAGSWGRDVQQLGAGPRSSRLALPGRMGSGMKQGDGVLDKAAGERKASVPGPVRGSAPALGGGT